MEFIRIGDKLINLRKINETVRRILQLRSEGLSQQEVASKLSLDRGFISGWNPWAMSGVAAGSVLWHFLLKTRQNLLPLRTATAWRIV